MSGTEYRAHFSMWCLLAAPLMAGNDIRSMTPEIHDILTNKEVIAVDQDPLGRQGRQSETHRRPGGVRKAACRWRDERHGISRAPAAEAAIAVSWTDLGYPDHVPAKVRDLLGAQRSRREGRQLFSIGAQPRRADGSCRAVVEGAAG
jgi:alpha-galactosidase